MRTAKWTEACVEIDRRVTASGTNQVTLWLNDIQAIMSKGPPPRDFATSKYWQAASKGERGWQSLIAFGLSVVLHFDADWQVHAVTFMRLSPT